MVQRTPVSGYERFQIPDTIPIVRLQGGGVLATLFPYR